MKLTDAVQLVGAILALIAIIVSVGSLLVARKAVAVSQAQAWDYLGAQNCANYRAEVLRLHERGMGREEIKEWFRKESAANPHVQEGYASAYEAFADGCGSVDELLDLLPQRETLQ